MSRQPTIKILVPGGHWVLAAHNPRAKNHIKYNAALHLDGCEKIVCHVFAQDDVAIDDGHLTLDSTHIYLGDQVDAVDQFLLDTGGYEAEES